MKQRVSAEINAKVLKKFRKIASSKSFEKGWQSLAIEQAMVDYIQKYGD